ncbi:MAG TPA: ThiF family adenylyltransferase [Candidatus Paceibacterota bacterium]|nr:ThiF family adenylyltransferase [Candidatus Paceibacterota bacterium]
MSKNLGNVLDKLASEPVESKPTILDLSREKDTTRLESLVKEGAIKQISDDYEEEQRELFGIKNPSKVYTPDFEKEFQAYYKSLQDEKPLHEHGRWAYLPWRYLAAHILPEDEYRIVRTARNRNLVTEEEQEKFYNAAIGIAGLSVGSSVAFAIALSGGGKKMKLADMDRLALSNTNRILAGADRLGMLKVEMAARTIYEINPYTELELFPDGLTEGNIEKFFDGLDIVVDEIDNLALKYLIREQARKRRIPIVMGADNGDNALIEIERHDMKPHPEFFHGRMGDVSYETLKGLDKFGIGKMITKWVGADTVTIRMQESLKEMGKTLVSWPQLGIAAMVNGAAVAYCVRKILAGQPLINDRALISLDEKLESSYDSKESQSRRRAAAEAFARSFGL